MSGLSCCQQHVAVVQCRRAGASPRARSAPAKASLPRISSLPRALSRTRGVVIAAAAEGPDSEVIRSPFTKARIHRQVGETAPKDLELTLENVDKVLEEVRPFLIADGGNVRVGTVQNGIVAVELEGACGSCASSTATMKMGIERSLKAAFGEKLSRVVEMKRVEPATVELVNLHLEKLRPAITNYGGSVEVLSVGDGNCTVKYTGPAPIAQGVKAAIKDTFPTIQEVIFKD